MGKGAGDFVPLLIELQKDLGMAMIFISHDLAVVREISHRVLVLYLGRVVEQTTRDRLYADPRHPYTKALLSAAPIADPEKERKRVRIRLEGEPPSPLDPKSIYRFLPSRAPVDFSTPSVPPQLEEVTPGHFVAEFEA